jgi:hypothetical protein
MCLETAPGRASGLLRLRLVFLSLLGAILLVAPPAFAGGVSLRIMLWGTPSEQARRPEESAVARYHPEQGVGFILDQSTSPPLLRFEDSQEVWVLQPQPGPRGDTIYRNDVGQPMLRATKLGGLTLFTLDHPDGSAAAYEGEATSLRPPPIMAPNALFQRIYQASVRSGHAAQRVIPFATVEDATPETANLIADSATATAEAISRVSHMNNGRVALSRIAKVLLARGHRPDAQITSGALTVTYAPDEGVQGRPSSERIVHVITK